ncbi:hypothetical protein [Streptomyces sp. NBC_01304]|uniref:hypothetical protein n=1 Tax=Streptomyces sp. NBC_01304 TaxID=2903818 RepID=UPI002E144275|nr:hypothetical protein OG430_22480 [Streptomyces sp. NBC_01304]
MFKYVRTCAAAATVVAALALTGCSSDGDGGKKGGSSSGGQEATGGGTGGSGATGDIDGTWVKTDGSAVVGLTVADGGKMVSLVELGGDAGATCTGTAASKTITLTCQGGGKRTKGTIESVDSSTLKVAWDGVGTDEFKKSDGKEMPGLPTDLPTDLDLPSDFEIPEG